MNPLRLIKEKLYFLKLWYRGVFLYPKEVINSENSLDYEAYWKEKHGNAPGPLSDWEKKRADMVLEHIPSDEGVTIGDIGCGEGSILKYIQGRRKVLSSIGYDYSDAVLKRGKDMGIKTIKLDVNSKDDLDSIEPADYMLLLEILEHTPHSERVLDAVFKKARKGVFFSFPNTGFVVYRLRLLFGKFPTQWILFPNEHLRFWTGTDVEWWLKALGYNDFEISYYVGGNYKPISFLTKLFPKLFGHGLFVFLKKKEPLTKQD